MSQKSQNTSVAASSASGFTATHSRTNSHTSPQSALVEGEQKRISGSLTSMFQKVVLGRGKGDSILNNKNSTLKPLQKRLSELQRRLGKLENSVSLAHEAVLTCNTQVSNKKVDITQWKDSVAKAEGRKKKKAEELFTKATLDLEKLKNRRAEAVARVAQLEADETRLRSKIVDATKAFNDAIDHEKENQRKAFNDTKEALMQFEAQNQAYIGGLIVATSGEQGTIATDNPGFADMNDFEGLL
jgi:chromosome segregation ATPase